MKLSQRIRDIIAEATDSAGRTKLDEKTWDGLPIYVDSHGHKYSENAGGQRGWLEGHYFDSPPPDVLIAFRVMRDVATDLLGEDGRLTEEEPIALVGVCTAAVEGDGVISTEDAWLAAVAERLSEEWNSQQ